jgi:murein DD-endopeptidase MepM/ murein hydrolase activator NlpD
MVIAVGLYFEYEDFMHNYREINFSKIYLSTYTCVSQEQSDVQNFQQKWIEGDFSAKEKNQQFVMVNRDQLYLEQDALDYAKKYNLEQEIKNFYKSSFVPEHEAGIARSETKATKKLISKQPLKQSTKKTYRIGLLHWPMDRKKFWLSSRFGPRKKEDGSEGFHYGIDMAAPKGTPVKAAGLGIVLEAGINNGYGKTILIGHADGIFQTRYAHLDHITVKDGQRVFAGQKVGTVGNTGAVRGKKGGKNAYHLHFEVKRCKKHIDPLKVLAA